MRKFHLPPDWSIENARPYVDLDAFWGDNKLQYSLQIQAKWRLIKALCRWLQHLDLANYHRAAMIIWNWQIHFACLYQFTTFSYQTCLFFCVLSFSVRVAEYTEFLLLLTLWRFFLCTERADPFSTVTLGIFWSYAAKKFYLLRVLS